MPNSFFQGTVFLYFTILVAAIHSFMGTVFVFQNSNCSHELHIYNIFDGYFYLTVVVILKEHLQPIHLSGAVIISGGHLQWYIIFKGTVSLWNKHL